MIRYFVIICFLFSKPLSAFSQTTLQEEDKKALRKKANHLFDEKRYNKALLYYSKLTKLTKGKNTEYEVRLAICYLNSNNIKTKALNLIKNNQDYFIKNKQEEDYHYYLGRAYHYNLQFDEAIFAYKKFLELTSKKNSKRVEEVNENIEACKYGKNLVKNAVEVTIENVGPAVNTQYSEYVPIITTDESVMMFTSRREGSTGGLQSPTGDKDPELGEYFEDIYVTLNINGKWVKPVKLGGNINTTGHDAAIGLSPDGRTLYVYKSDEFVFGNIYAYEQSGYSWSKGEKLPSPINTKYWEGSISITPDGSTVFFSSNRPKKGALGAGDKDIYMVKRLPNGEWAEPANLGSIINTDKDEDAPFIHPDGKTLYFSSKGHNTMGGFDIFVTKYENGRWSIPVNIGYPINTPDDDLYFVLSDDGQRGYYSTTRPEGYGDKDIYTIHFNKKSAVSPSAITLYKGKVLACLDSALINATITARNTETNEIAGIYKPNSNTKNYIIVAPKGASYKITVKAEGYHPYETTIKTPEGDLYKEELLNFTLCNDQCPEVCQPKPTKSTEKKIGVVKISRPEEEEIDIDEVLKGLEVKIHNVYFKTESAELKSESYAEIDKIIDLMKQYSDIVVVIGAHTDSRGRSSYNEWLSLKRAEAVVKYMVSKGIEKDRLLARGFGETKPLNHCKDGVDCTEEEHGINRRITFQIIGRTFNLNSSK